MFSNCFCLYHNTCADSISLCSTAANLLRKNLVKIYYKNVKKVAYYKDFYLINQLILNVDDNQQIHIDHLLFADKYIYVILDKFYPGKLSGKPEDESLLFCLWSWA